ncbi:UNVERIFIED_CONTAM: hypothetical protein PYX00_011127 [Menopon gallinae]|uniref:Peptidase M24 domain-containing protein n=1 Tax=Menopon gallinae TaxID=328185 RepID=A0AAW2H619_9NEOP
MCKETPYFYYLKLNKISEVSIHNNIISQLKTVKNSTEILNTKIAHYKDGAAFTKLILWLNEEIKTKELTEIQVYNKIDNIKKSIDTYKGNSFSSIVAVNKNAAFPHYDPLLSLPTNIDKNSILLIDCGGQYLEGTTDTTRTLTFKEPSNEFKRFFTLTLKGLIALSSIKFPLNTPGRNLDVLARQFLWNEGLDYNHGTGHGVGHYLSVHEEPIRFNQICNTSLVEGMIISIEPGFYQVNHFGIRIENLVVVQKVQNNDKFLELIPLTFYTY